MKQSFLFPLILAAVLVILGGVYLATQKPVYVAPTPQDTTVIPESSSATPATPVVSTPTPGASQTPKPTSGGYTVSTVALHASASDCWTIVRGGVYNLTSWINQHPGGAGAILSMCGRDATASFEAQHGGQRRPEAELVSFKIGGVSQ